MFSEATVDRYWARVEKRGPEECWPWKTGGRQGGYGSLKVNNKQVRATHMALFLDGRPRTDGLYALHSCDNPPCVNPRHLRWGTHTENIQDMVSRGRFARWAGRRAGENNLNARLTRDAVIKIRAAAPFRTQQSLADEFGVSQTTVSCVLSRKNWKDLP